MKDVLLAIALTIAGVFLVAFGFVLLPIYWPPTLSAAASGATIAYYSASWQPLAGTAAAIDSLTQAPTRPDLYAFRFMFAVIGLALLVSGLLIFAKVVKS